MMTAILWGVVRPDMWAWALGYGFATITLLSLAHNSGVRKGNKSAISTELSQQDEDTRDEVSTAEAQLEAFETTLAIKRIMFNSRFHLKNHQPEIE